MANPNFIPFAPVNRTFAITPVMLPAYFSPYYRSPQFTSHYFIFSTASSAPPPFSYIAPPASAAPVDLPIRERVKRKVSVVSKPPNPPLPEHGYNTLPDPLTETVDQTKKHKFKCFRCEYSHKMLTQVFDHYALHHDILYAYECPGNCEEALNAFAQFGNSRNAVEFDKIKKLRLIQRIDFESHIRTKHPQEYEAFVKPIESEANPFKQYHRMLVTKGRIKILADKFCRNRRQALRHERKKATIEPKLTEIPATFAKESRSPSPDMNELGIVEDVMDLLNDVAFSHIWSTLKE